MHRSLTGPILHLNAYNPTFLFETTRKACMSLRGISDGHAFSPRKGGQRGGFHLQLHTYHLTCVPRYVDLLEVEVGLPL